MRQLKIRCRCGGHCMPAKRGCHLESNPHPRVHLSTGWRHLGGE